MKTPHRPLLFVCIWLCFALLLMSCQATPAAARTPSGEAGRQVRILFLGRDRAAGLADSMMLVNVETATGEIRVLQIPRDTYAEYTEKDYKKINGLLNEKGERGSVEFLSDALGVKLDYFAILDLDSLAALVDAVGGVEVEIDRPMDYSDPEGGLEIHLSPGKTRLDGRHAEEFIRYRSGYANGDIGRLDAQKQFIRGFVGTLQALSPANRAKVD